MIRIKVIKASRLVLGLAVALLVIVLLIVAGRYLFSGAASADEQPRAGEILTATEAGEAVFTAASFIIFDNAPGREAEPARSASPAPLPTANAPTVLIYHTHTHEAYAQVEGEEYVETSAWRTADADHSIVRVGEELAALLRMYGFRVTHDGTDNEQPDFDTAYARSLETIAGYAEPFDLYIDMHRDAYSQAGSGSVFAATVNGQSAARLMTLVGKGENFREKPDYQANYAFASALTELLNERHPGLCRDVMVKENRYNQHVGTPALLIEVGHNRNTLEEALASMPYLADALATLMLARQPGNH